VDGEQTLRLVEPTVAEDDPDPKALACYGLLRPQTNTIWLRFVDGRPLSVLTTQFLAWLCERLEAEGKAALLLIWDNASWHVSQEVRRWLCHHNRQVKGAGRGVRILPCYLPVKSPWLNNIEPHWIHGKRNVVEPACLLSTRELADRACAYFGCSHEEHLAIPGKVA
jgi:transposase